jgi:hypothetical protein
MSAREPRQRRGERQASFEERLGWRIAEWVALTGISRPTVWRQAKSGALRLIYIDKIPIVPRTEAVRLGLIES